MSFSIIVNNMGLFLGGLWLTVQMTALSLAIGLAMSVPLTLARMSSNRLISSLVRFYVYLFRGTPLLVQMFLIYYGMGQFDGLKRTFLWVFFEKAYFCALLAFTLNTCAYTIEILRGAIESVPTGEIEAARALGMSGRLVTWRIVLPGAFRRAIPVYGNEVILMLHATSLASIITLIDLTGAARIINSRYYSPYEAFLTAGAFYLCLTLAIVWLFKRLEKRFFTF